MSFGMCSNVLFADFPNVLFLLYYSFSDGAKEKYESYFLWLSLVHYFIFNIYNDFIQ